MPAAAAAAAGGRGGGRGLGGGRGFGPTIIPLDGRPHIASSIKQYMGDGPAMIDSAFASKIRLTITQQPGYQLYEYSCHEGNGAVSYTLSGERAYERMVADAKAKGLPIPPRTMGMEVYSGAPLEGRQPVRELGGGKE